MFLGALRVNLYFLFPYDAHSVVSTFGRFRMGALVRRWWGEALWNRKGKIMLKLESAICECGANPLRNVTGKHFDCVNVGVGYCGFPYFEKRYFVDVHSAIQ